MSDRTIAQLSSIIDSVPTAIVMLDPRGNIDLVNAQAERLFKYARAELIGETVEILIPPRLRGGHLALRASFQREPSVRRMGAGRDLFGLRKDGTEFPIEIGLNPIETEGGLYVVSAIVDITERRRMEARFRAMVESAPMAMVMSITMG
jgi:PAS domain S-box-containing protein